MVTKVDNLTSISGLGPAYEQGALPTLSLLPGEVSGTSAARRQDVPGDGDRAKFHAASYPSWFWYQCQEETA